MNPDDFRKIIDSWLDGSLPEESQTLLGRLLMQPEYQEQLDAIMQERQEQGYDHDPLYQDSYQRMRNVLESKAHTGKRRIPVYWWAAAAVLLLVMAGWWMFDTGKKTVQPVAGQPEKIRQIAPGQEGAILTLADGSSLVLDSMGNGMVAQQTGAEVLLNNGQLEYKSVGGKPGEELYNTLTTPKGRQFRIVLPDGTVAWLNAASSISFPTRFTKDVRRVNISGEVYFEAATKIMNGAPVPFIVNADNRFEVEVLGTHFNVNTYADEPELNTTLLEGKVAVNRYRSKERVILKPGQQASLDGDPRKPNNLLVRKANVGKVMAWKEGIFDFEDARIDEVMRQLKRWYDIDVKYESGVPDIEFVGKMTRDITLNGLLIALEKSNVHFRLEGRTLIVMP